MQFNCATCGAIHSELPHLGFFAPWHWSDEFDTDDACLLTGDLCIIKGEDYFVRGVIGIPVLDFEHEFGWGVWVSHKKENFETYQENYSNCEGIGPFFGWLSNLIDYYPVSTLNLKTMVHYLGNSLRPSIEVEESDHPLSVHQRKGITFAEAWEMVHYVERSS